jgi:hypothetical protein
MDVLAVLMSDVTVGKGVKAKRSIRTGSVTIELRRHTCRCHWDEQLDHPDKLDRDLMQVVKVIPVVHNKSRLNNIKEMCQWE